MTDTTHVARIGRTQYRIRRFSSRRDFTGHQVLERRRRILGVWLPWREIDREEVPEWAAIQLATVGYTDWRSRLFLRLAAIYAEGA